MFDVQCSITSCKEEQFLPQIAPQMPPVLEMSYFFCSLIEYTSVKAEIRVSIVTTNTTANEFILDIFQNSYK